MKTTFLSKPAPHLLASPQANNGHSVHFADDFYQVFVRDLQNAQGSVLILSAYMSSKRILFLQPYLQDCVERGVRVCAFVQRPAVLSIEDDERTVTFYRNRKLLMDMAIHLTDFPGVHAKVAVIDEEIAWDGSLNILSHYKTEERMTRWQSREKVNEIIRSHRLDCCAACCERPGFCVSAQKDIEAFVHKQTIEVGIEILARRRTLGLSQKDLSNLSGISQTHIAEIETGAASANLRTLAKLGRVLGTTFKNIPLHLEPRIAQIVQSKNKE
ncbi:MAG TPA: helix-turn-helix domain-containing protein [Planktothrix sp.]|jgi:DNA-binding XRE family transcriptional regulator